MPPLARLPRSRAAFTRLLALVAGLAGTALPASVRGQAMPSHTEDAAPIPAGMLRLRIIPSWTRFDERFAPGGTTTTLGAELSAQPLGTAQLPRLVPVEAGLRTLASDPSVRLSFGRLSVGSSARIVTMPIVLEYGLTRRLSVGVVVPVVQTRRVVQAGVNVDSAANVGFVRADRRAAAATLNLAVATAYQQAAADLATLIATCQQNRNAAGCGPVNANAADAAAVRVAALSYAAGVTALGTNAGAALVAPQANSDLAQVIDAQRLALNIRLQQYLGAGAGAPNSIYLTPFKFSYLDLQGSRGSPGLLQSEAAGGLDSLYTTERVGLGDVAVGAQLLVLDRFHRGADSPPGLQTRLSVGALVRFATSVADSARNLSDIATGDGAGVEVRGALDLIAGRLGGTVAARYVKAFERTVQASVLGDPEAPFPYPLFGERTRRAGDVAGLDVTPRYLLNEILAVNGHYGFARSGGTTYGPGSLEGDPCPSCQSTVGPSELTTAPRTAQRVGLGFRYSTVDAFASRRARYPVELSFTHLETIRGGPGEPKDSRQQIQLRLFYQLRR